jgi:hypothetical protein
VDALGIETRMAFIHEMDCIAVVPVPVPVPATVTVPVPATVDYLM